MIIKPKMYVRTYKGQIYKVAKIEDGIGIIMEDSIDIFGNGEQYGSTCCEEKDIKKASYNIIDLIEVGDYVNGSIVTKTTNNSLGTYIEINYGENRKGIYNEEIKSIITHEQFESIKYEVK